MALIKKVLSLCLLILLVGATTTAITPTDSGATTTAITSTDSGATTTAPTPTDSGATTTAITSTDSGATTTAPTPTDSGATTTAPTPTDSGATTTAITSTDSGATTTAPTPTDSGATTTAPTPTDSGATTTAPTPTDSGATTTAPTPTDSGATTTAPTPTDSDPCASNPCLSDSTCQQLLTNYTCVCRPGLFYNETLKLCTLARTFPTDLRFPDMTYKEAMKNKNSKEFQTIAHDILKEIKEVFKGKNGYLGSTVLSLNPGSVIADVENFFSLSSEVNKIEVEEALKSATGTGSGFLKGATVEPSDICRSGFCEDSSTVCTAENGLANCVCKGGYVKLTATQQACYSCPSGEKAVGDQYCKPCPFGYSGFNCKESYLLILVVVACVLGVLLLGTLIGTVVLYTRSTKTTKSSEKDTPKGNLEFNKPAGIPRIPRVNPNTGWQPTNLEMTDSGSRRALVTKDRTENTAMWDSDYSDDTRGYKSQMPSRTGYGAAGAYNGSRASKNPYSDVYGDRIRRY
ncbi:mucin-13b isoform X16 [Pangasianodon hypophthalmus]|uniref:mucin-13b isoform X11 n=1 Tax=Pangasianodon hypophthalmus TaxID=310915 RepID=UPI00230755D5|nr:mucin-13b isoform X11 [Pangasianodon hypophthalmus]XP_053094897.1 mucin-13b isoform X12 [Pangasianodon hypophthalmus]XP_053094899.1 mucin-13b isoform X14 [Pangasianodon hypophthalmus]XP_053094902.1 mucin-13b isoform X16 [Pangasianodon hypophthalmus]